MLNFEWLFFSFIMMHKNVNKISRFLQKNEKVVQRFFSCQNLFLYQADVLEV